MGTVGVRARVDGRRSRSSNLLARRCLDVFATNPQFVRKRYHDLIIYVFIYLSIHLFYLFCFVPLKNAGHFRSNWFHGSCFFGFLPVLSSSLISTVSGGLLTPCSWPHCTQQLSLESNDTFTASTPLLL